MLKPRKLHSPLQPQKLKRIRNVLYPALLTDLFLNFIVVVFNLKTTKTANKCEWGFYGQDL